MRSPDTGRHAVRVPPGKRSESAGPAAPGVTLPPTHTLPRKTRYSALRGRGPAAPSPGPTLALGQGLDAHADHDEDPRRRYSTSRRRRTSARPSMYSPIFLRYVRREPRLAALRPDLLSFESIIHRRCPPASRFLRQLRLHRARGEPGHVVVDEERVDQRDRHRAHERGRHELAPVEDVA